MLEEDPLLEIMDSPLPGDFADDLEELLNAEQMEGLPTGPAGNFSDIFAEESEGLLMTPLSPGITWHAGRDCQSLSAALNLWLTDSDILPCCFFKCNHCCNCLNLPPPHKG